MNVLPLQATDLAAAATILATSFKNYEVMRYILSDSGEQYQEHVTELFLSLYQMSLANNWPVYGVKIDNQWVAAAIAYHSSSHEILIGSDQALQQFCTKISTEAVRRMDCYDFNANAAHPQTPHIFIDSLGTLPEHQGRGYAKALLLKYQALSKNDTESKGVGLNTESANNIPFYQSMGYTLNAEQSIESIKSWSLFRPDS